MSGHFEKSLNPAYTERRSFSDGKRFVYQNFSQRVAAANIDVFHQLTADEADASGDSDVPLAARALERWVELNCTRQFDEFRKELEPMLMSLPLILRQRELIFEAVRRHLAGAPSIALKPMLEVTAALAADLRQEFYPEFKPLLATLANLLTPSDVEQLEDVFSTLCYLFKYLLKQLLADLPAAFACYRTLLAHERAHVREFAAESFAYLLRRLPVAQLPSTLGHILSQHAGRHGPSLDEGIANLFFFATKGLDHRFHSRTPAFVRAMLAMMAPNESGSRSRRLHQATARFHVVSMAMRLMAEETRRPHADDVWSPLLQSLQAAIEEWEEQIAHARRHDDAPADIPAAESRAESASAPAAASRGAARTTRQRQGAAVDAPAVRASPRLAARTDASLPPSASDLPELPRGATRADESARLSALIGAETRLTFIARLTCEWVSYRKGQRVPEGGRPALLKVLSLALAPDSLEGAHCSPAVVWELLLVLSAVLQARGPPMEDQAMLEAVAPVIRRVVTADPGTNLAEPTDDTFALDAASPPPPLWIGARLALELLGWRAWEEAVLPSLLDACEAQAAVRPHAVLGALLKVALEKDLQLALPPSGASAELLCSVLEARGAESGSAAGAAASRLWAAMVVLARLSSSSLLAVHRRVGASLDRLMTSAAASSDRLMALRGEWRAAVFAAAVGVHTNIVASTLKGGDLTGIVNDSVLPCMRTLRVQLQEPQGGAAHSLLHAATQLLSQLPAPLPVVVAEAIWGIMAAEMEQLVPLLLRYLTHEAAAVRGRVLELLQVFLQLGWLPDDQPVAVLSDLDRLEERLGQSTTSRPRKKEKRSPATQHRSTVGQVLQLGLAIEASPLEPNSKQLVNDVDDLIKIARTPSLATFTAQLLAHLSLGMLRVKFARLWPLVRPLQQQLGQQAPELLWPVLLECLQQASAACCKSVEATPASEEEEAAERPAARPAVAGEKVEDREEAAHGIQAAWDAALAPPARGTQPHQFASLVLDTLATPPLLPLVVEHSVDLMPMWQSLTRLPGVLSSGGVQDDGEEESMSAKPAKGERAVSRALLLSWLRMFGAVEDPKQLHGSAELYMNCNVLVGHSDARVQSAALECLARWEQPVLVQHKKQLLSLISDKTFRETLALFSLDSSGDRSTLPQSHRPLLLPLLTRLLFAKLTQRGGRGSSKNHQSQRRATIFAFFAGFEPKELQPLVDLLLSPLAAVGADDADVSSGCDSSARKASALERVSASKQLGVVRATLECVQQVGQRLRPYLPQLLACTLHLLLYATHCVCHAEGRDADEADALPKAVRLERCQPIMWQSQAREARVWCVKLLSQLLLTFPEYDYSPYLPMFFSSLTPMLNRLPTQYTQSPAGVLSLIQVMVQQSSTVALLEYSPVAPLPCAYAMLATRSCASSVVDVVLSLVEALLDHIDGGESRPLELATTTGEATDSDGDGEPALLGAPSAAAGNGPADAPNVVEAAAVAKRLLHAYMPDLLRNLHQRLKSKFGGDATKALAAAGGGEQATRELKLFTRLSSHVSSAELAEPLLELFLPYLKLKSTPRSERVKEQVIKLIHGLLRVVSQPEQHLRYFGVQFGTLRSRGAREAHCKLFSSLSHLAPVADLPHLHQFGEVAALLEKLNAYDEEQLDEPDYDKRLDGYNEFPALLAGLHSSLALPLLCQFIHDVELDDIALKHAASHAVGLLVEHTAKQPKETGWEALMMQVLMPTLRRGLRLPGNKDSLRLELLKILADSLLKMPSLQPELATLLSPKEPEADFFFNITHVQMPRRQRALARLAARVREGVFGAATLSNYLLPLLRHLVLRDVAKEIDVAEEAVHTLREVAARLPWRPYLSTLQGFARQLKREPNLERRLVRATVAVLDAFHFDLVVPDSETAGEEASATGAMEQPLEADTGSSLAVDKEEEGDEPEGGELLLDNAGDQANGLVDEDALSVDDEMSKDSIVASGPGSEEDQQKRAAAVMHAVRGKLLPELYSHLKDPKTEGVRVPVALAVLKLLLLLPASIMTLELRGFLIRVVGTLSSRDKKQRDVGRDTLGKVVLELGARNFGAVLHELTTSLTKGYQLHVLGYTIHYLLGKLVPTLQPGDLDYCINPLVNALLADVFGEAAEKKEVEAIATAMKESRVTKSFSSFELVASVVTFTPNEQTYGINSILPPIHQAVLNAPGGADSLKNINTVRELLRYIALGLNVNQSVNMHALSVFVQGMLNTHLPPPRGSTADSDDTDADPSLGGAKRRKVTQPVGSVLQPVSEPGVTNGRGLSPLSHELNAFALSLLLGALRRGEFSHNPQAVSLLEPLLPLLQRAMRSDGTMVVQMALRTVAAILPFPVPTLPKYATLLLDRTLTILKRTANFKGSELVGIAMKVITSLLRKPKEPNASAPAGFIDNENDDSDDDQNDNGDAPRAGGSASGQPPVHATGGGASLDEKHLRWLINFVSVHLEDDALQGSLFRLLRVIFGRRFVLPELYDLVIVLGEMVLQAEAVAVRSACAKLYLTFMLHYPLGPKRLQQHMRFLMTNLSYPVPCGRLSLLSLVKDMCHKLPLPLLHKESQAILIALVARLVNDDDVQCRVAVGEAIKKLLARTCATDGDGECAVARERLLKLIKAWHEDSQPQLGRAAAQLAGLAIDALGPSSSCMSQQLQPLIVKWCAHEATVESASELAARLPDPDSEEALTLQVRWQAAYYALKALEKLCVHEPATLLGDGCEPLWSHVQTLLLHEHSWLRSAAARLLGLLLASVLPATLADGGGSIPTYLRQQGVLLQLTDASISQLHSAVLTEGAADQALRNLLWLSNALLSHPSLGPASCAASLPPGRDVPDQHEGSADFTPAIEMCWPLVAVARRLAPLTLARGAVRGSAAMRWYAAISTKLEGEQLTVFLPVLLPVVVRTAEDTSGKVHEEVKQTAAGTLQLLQRRSEAPAFVGTYQQIKEVQKARRRSRKEKEALEAVADPELAASKRMAINLGKRKQKQRKLQRMKRGRDSGGSIGVGSRKKKRSTE